MDYYFCPVNNRTRMIMKKFILICLTSVSINTFAQSIDVTLTLMNDTVEEMGITAVHHENDENIILSWGTDGANDSLLYVSTVNKQGERLWNSTLLDSAALPSAIIYKKGNNNFVTFSTQTQGANSILYADSVTDESRSTKYVFELEGQYVLNDIKRVNAQSYILASNISQNQMSLFRFGENDSLLLYHDIELDNDNEHKGVSLYQNEPDNTNGFYIFGNTPNRICMLETDLSGNVKWNRYYSNDSLLQVMSTTRFKDDFVITGNNTGFGINEGNIFLMQMDEQGDNIWWHAIGEEDEETKSWDIVNDDDNGFFLAGSAKDASGNFRSFLLKTDTMGITIDTDYWQIDMDAEENIITSISPSGSDDYVLLGSKKINNFRQVLFSYFGYSFTDMSLPSFANIRTYPNPAHDFIHFAGQQPVHKAEIYTMSGELKSVKKLDDVASIHRISVQDLSPGTYILLVYGETEIYRSKFIRQ
jgi:hypothetical protein